MPFTETYLAGSNPEDIQHFGGVRFRLQGTGDLLMTLYDLDKVTSSELLPLTMSLLANREPTRLSNFVTQRAILNCRTEEINEFMQINRLIIFIRPIYTSYPGIT